MQEIPTLRTVDAAAPSSTPDIMRTIVKGEAGLAWLSHLRSAPSRRASRSATIEYESEDNAVGPITSAIRRLAALQRLLGRSVVDGTHACSRNVLCLVPPMLQSAHATLCAVSPRLSEEDEDDYDSGDDDKLPADLDRESFGSLDTLHAEVLCTQLAKVVDLLRTSRRRSSTMMRPLASGNSFLKMVSLCDLDEENQKWLASQFTTASSGRPLSGKSTAALPPVREEGAGDATAGADSGCGGAGWGVDVNSPLPGLDSVELFYRDLEGDVQGPFSLDQIRNWQVDGYLDSDLPVRVGADGDFLPLGEQSNRLACLQLRDLVSCAVTCKEENIIEGDVRHMHILPAHCHFVTHLVCECGVAVF